MRLSMCVFIFFCVCVSVYVCIYAHIDYDNEINHFFIEDLLHSLLVCGLDVASDDVIDDALRRSID